MKPARWACCSAVAVALWLAAAGVGGGAGPPPPPPPHADLLVDDRALPPPDDAAWQPVRLPDASHDGKARAVWLRIAFERPADGEAWAVYWPYLYGGGAFWLNGALLASVPQSDAKRHVRWQRPQLIPLPEIRLRPGANVLQVRVVAADPPNGLLVARPAIGPHAALLPQHDRRLLWMRTMPQAIGLACLLASLLVAFIWWRRPSEVLYGLFALALALWGARTLVFVVEQLPSAEWAAARAFYHAATGGFIVVLALFAMRYAGAYRPWVGRALFGYWAIGPLVRLLPAAQAEAWVGRLWIAGMIPVGMSIAVFIGRAWWRDRSAASAALLAAVALAVTAGVHDYLVAWRAPVVELLLPGWTGHRILLMHHGATLLLLVMGFLLTARFVDTLFEVEVLNRTLEERIAAREAALAENYARLAQLERERATTEERQRIMQDMHDGLGSQLVTALYRTERGALDAGQTSALLRGCIDDMRLAIDALAPADQDFGVALANLRWRWQPQLDAAGIASQWTIEAPDDGWPLSAHAGLQVLRVLQEALTNVIKHARAGRVEVAVRTAGGDFVLDVRDDGRGIAAAAASPSGRGLANMAQRAQRIGARLQAQPAAPGTRVVLTLPVAAARIA